MDPCKVGVLDKSKIVRQDEMSVEEVLQMAADEGIELIRASEGKGMGRGLGSTTGYRGVVYVSKAYKSKPYRAQICVPNGGGTYFLGCFRTAEEAALCYARNRHLMLPENLVVPSTPPRHEPAPYHSSSVLPPPKVANRSLAKAAEGHALAGGGVDTAADTTPTAIGAAPNSAAADLVIAPGTQVEVRMHEDGLRGSSFPAKIIGGDSRMVQVIYDAFDDEDGHPIVHTVPASQLIPLQPPPPPSPQWLEPLPLGCSLEMLCEGGWWHVQLCARAKQELHMNACNESKAAQVQVEFVGYHLKRWADYTQLRPRSRMSSTRRGRTFVREIPGTTSESGIRCADGDAVHTEETRSQSGD